LRLYFGMISLFTHISSLLE
jgi:hypothetical protein